MNLRGGVIINISFSDKNSSLIDKKCPFVPLLARF